VAAKSWFNQVGDSTDLCCVLRTVQNSHRQRHCAGRHSGRSSGLGKRGGFPEQSVGAALPSTGTDRATTGHWLLREDAEPGPDLRFHPGPGTGL
jgi:hypothetical protein